MHQSPPSPSPPSSAPASEPPLLVDEVEREVDEVLGSRVLFVGCDFELPFSEDNANTISSTKNPSKNNALKFGVIIFAAPDNPFGKTAQTAQNNKKRQRERTWIFCWKSVITKETIKNPNKQGPRF